MKTVVFIRHSRLIPPYDNYDVLSYRQICGLASTQIDPAIHPTSKALIKPLVDLYGRQTEVLMHSSAQRARETALLFQQLSSKKAPLSELDLLREIQFDIPLVLSESAYNAGHMPALRTALYQAIMQGKKAESISQILARIRRLQSAIQGRKEHYILCITHSFFMRFLSLYFRHNKIEKSDYSTEILLNEPNYEYASGFDITL